ncbi:hypothetical protein LTR36_002925 [Oleoguttula mirabilis]|uniref:non-specific serine/threonine protein kinase n=1 Tax=Oleoguttula mirabilis TaxID=1507867 RepID=A0AAV9JK18_9PEZI|nr:hypothetical protein LTR36_002925 [Oleoguttula mirabilis]
MDLDLMMQQAMMAKAMRRAAMERALGQDPRMAMMRDPRMAMMHDPRMAMMRDPQIAMIRDPRMAMMQDPRMAMIEDPRMAIMRDARMAMIQDPRIAMIQDPHAMLHGRGPRKAISGDGSKSSTDSAGRNPFATCLGGRGRHHRGDRHGNDIPVPGYKLVEPLQPGGMSEAVNLVKEMNSGKLFVEKRRVERGRNLNYMIKCMWDERKGFCSFILEYCDGGSLDQKIADRIRKGRMFEDGFVWHTLVGIAKALAFLHHGIRDFTKDEPADTWDTICHLDTKPRNIFFSSAGQEGPHLRVVVGDFGCAVKRSDLEFGMEHPRQQMCGTPEWYPPEGRIEMVGATRTRYGSASDIWQMGATIHTMCRLLERPDPSIYTLDPWSSACGRRYGERLNGAVLWCCFPKWQKRPSAFKLAKEVVKMARDKGIPQLATMRG